MIESQPREIDHTIAEDAQFWRVQLLLHMKSLNEMEEFKRFQGSTFDTISRRGLIEDRDTILELTGKIQELQHEKIAWMIREIFKMLNQYAVDNPTLLVNQSLSHLIQILVEC